MLDLKDFTIGCGLANAEGALSIWHNEVGEAFNMRGGTIAGGDNAMREHLDAPENAVECDVTRVIVELRKIGVLDE